MEFKPRKQVIKTFNLKKCNCLNLPSIRSCAEAKYNFKIFHKAPETKIMLRNY